MPPVRRDPAPAPVLRERWAPSGQPDHVARFAPSRLPLPPVQPTPGSRIRDAASHPAAGPRATARRRSERASRGRATAAFALVALAFALAAASRWVGWPSRAGASTASAAVVPAADRGRPATEGLPPVDGAIAPAAGCPSGAASAASAAIDATADAAEELQPTAAAGRAPDVAAQHPQARQVTQAQPPRPAAASDAISAAIHAAQSKADAFLREQAGAPAGR